jgi:hypothetical protein
MLRANLARFGKWVFIPSPLGNVRDFVQRQLSCSANATMIPSGPRT